MTTKHYDLAVYNGSPAGIACAVRAAREGLSVLMVNHTPILGGMISNGNFEPKVALDLATRHGEVERSWQRT